MNTTSFRWICLTVSVIACLCLSPAAEAQKKRVITVGVVSDGESVASAVLLDKIKEQAQSLAGSEFALTFPNEKQLDGAFDPKKIDAHLDTLLADKTVNMVLAYGAVAGNAAGSHAKLQKPVLVPFVIDRKLQKMPYSKGKSGRANLSYIEFPWSIPRDLQVFREVTNASSMTFLLDQYILDAIPGLDTQAVATAAAHGVKMKVLGVGSDIGPVIEHLSSGPTAVYLAPLGQLSAESRAKLHKEFIKHRVATFSIQGEMDVRQGVLVGRRSLASGEKIARRVALDLVRIAGGERPDSLAVSLTLPERLLINLKTAKAIGLSPSWQVLTEAELVDADKTKAARKVDLRSVIKDAIDGNLDLKALELSLQAGDASVRSARSSLLPRLSMSTTAQALDRDRAIFTPQYLWNGTISATQVLWSERAWAALDVEKLSQEGRKQELQTGTLDVVGSAANAYLSVVRAKTRTRILRQNLEATRVNLETARAQFDAGAISQADVFRWESQIANDRRRLIEAVRDRNLAEISLQQILNRPTEERFETSDELATPEAIALLQGIDKYLHDPWTFRLFRQFVIAEALANSPELQQLDASIALQKRLEKSSKRALYMPTVSATGSVTQRFYRGGEASTAMPGEANGTDWFAGVTLSVPLYEGGRYAEIDRNSLEVMRLQALKKNFANSISQRAATRMHQMGSSFAGIALSRESASSAKKNYELVANAYAQGAVRIVDVIDAQNAWFSADSQAADTVYAFLIDWINVQRGLGLFFSLMSAQEREDLILRVNEYIAAERLSEPGN